MNKVPGAAYLLAILVVVFSIFGSGFATAANLLNIGVQSSVLLLLALPMTLIIMSEGLDLSMGAVLSLAGVVLAFGVANGLLVVALGLPPFVATLGTLGVAQGLALVVSGGQSVVGIGDALPALYGREPLGVPFAIWIAAAAFALFRLAFRYTRLASYVSALGGN